MNLNIDTVIFIGFLAVNLIVGLGYGKKANTIKDYALGGRNFSTGALVATIVATWVSGSGFFIDLSNTYSDGLYYLIAVCSMGVSLTVTAYFLIPRMGEFLGKISIAEVMGDLYGIEVKLITAISGILGTIGLIAVQFKAFGNVFNYFLGIESTYSVLIASAIVISYSAFGGIRAVTYTDIVQFVTFGFVVPLIGIIIWNHVYDGDFSFLQQIENDPNFNYREVLNFKNPKFWEMIPLILYFGLPSIIAMDFQRISMGRSIEQVKKAWYISAILLVLFTLATGWIPFLLKAVNPNLPPDQILNYIADNYTYTGLKGLIVIGIAAMAMSTADSCINASAVLFANDIGKVLNMKINDLLLSKIFSLLLGVFAIYLALSKADLLGMVMTSASLYMPVVTVPLLLAIFGFRSTKIPVLIGMGAGFITILTTNIFDIRADGIIWGMLMNLTFFIGSHYLLRQPGGWVGIKDTTYLDRAKIERRRRREKLIKSIRSFSFIEFAKKSAPKNELVYMGLGIYCIFYTFTTMYSTQVELLKENGNFILIIYQIMMVTGVLLGMYPIWPARIKKEIIVQVAWNIVVFYMLVLFSCFFVMLSRFGPLQFAVFTINIIITAILVGWKLGTAMIISGFYLSFQFYKYYTGIDSLDISVGSPEFVFMYSLMLIGSALVIFLRPNQEYQKLTEERNEHLNGRIDSQEKQLREALALRGEFIRNISHEYHAPMTGITSTAQTLVESYDKLTEAERKEAAGIILKNSNRLDVFDSNISSLAKLSKPNHILNLEPTDLSELLYERIEICRKLYEENPGDREFVFDIKEKLISDVNKFYFTQIFDNLLINAINYCKEGKITISLSQNKTGVHFTITDEGIGVPPAELENIFLEFVVSSRTRTPAGGRGVGLALCKRAIEVHGGTIQAESDGKKGTVVKFTLPAKSVKKGKKS